jgi:hypothetical protein
MFLLRDLTCFSKSNPRIDPRKECLTFCRVLLTKCSGPAIDINVKMIYDLRSFQKALICANRIINTLVMEEKVIFFRRGSRSRPRPRTPELRIQNSRPYYWCLDTNRAIVPNFSFLGAIAAEK